MTERFAPSILLHGLVSGEKAHSILLELVRRIAQDRPSDMVAAFDRLHDLQTYINCTTSDGIVALSVEEIVAALDAAKATLLAEHPEAPIARWQPARARKQRAEQHVRR